MRSEFVSYLKAIGMTDVLVKRVEEVYEFYRSVCPDEITDIFVTDFLKEDGNRDYENLWFFSQGYVMEAKNFVTKDEFDMTPLLKSVFYWLVEKQDYNFLKASEKSRLHIKVNFSVGLGMIGGLKASKENCDYLKDIFHKHLLANLSR
jgi:hypothetical protein